jgi:hypothetical protein
MLETGSHAMPNPLVVVQDLGFLQVADPQIRGILGANFLEHFDLFLDCAHNMLCLDDAKLMRPQIKGKHIELVTLSYREGGVLLTEPLIISIHLSGLPHDDAVKALEKIGGQPADSKAAAALADPFMFQDYYGDRSPELFPGSWRRRRIASFLVGSGQQDRFRPGRIVNTAFESLRIGSTQHSCETSPSESSEQVGLLYTIWFRLVPRNVLAFTNQRNAGGRVPI